MIRISLDGQEANVNEKAATVQEMITEVLGNLPQERIVTEITLDGRQYYLRQKQLAEESPANYETLQIRTTDRKVLEKNGFEIALSDVRRVQQSLINVAELFREKKLADANLLFARCLDSMARFIETLSATREILKVDFSQIHLQNGTLALVEKEFNLILEGLFQCQEDQDHMELADRIEYELLTNLHTWTHALHTLRNTHQD